MLLPGLGFSSCSQWVPLAFTPSYRPPMAVLQFGMETWARVLTLSQWLNGMFSLASGKALVIFQLLRSTHCLYFELRHTNETMEYTFPSRECKLFRRNQQWYQKERSQRWGTISTCESRTLYPLVLQPRCRREFCWGSRRMKGRNYGRLGSRQGPGFPSRFHESPPRCYVQCSEREMSPPQYKADLEGRVDNCCN